VAFAFDERCVSRIEACAQSMHTMCSLTSDIYAIVGTWMMNPIKHSNLLRDPASLNYAGDSGLSKDLILISTSINHD